MTGQEQADSKPLHPLPASTRPLNRIQNVQGEWRAEGIGKSKRGSHQGTDQRAWVIECKSRRPPGISQCLHAF